MPFRVLVILEYYSNMLQPPKEPVQLRSRRTVKSVTDGAFRLLKARDFEDIPVSDFVKAAGASVSSFYARFPSKDEFLLYLAENVLVDTIAPAVAAKLERALPANASLEERFRTAFVLMTEAFQQHRRIFRPVTLRMHASGDTRFKDIAIRFNRPIHEAFVTLITAGPELARTRVPRTDIEEVLSWCGAVLRQSWLLREPPPPREARRITGELAKCMSLYLLSKV